MPNKNFYKLSVLGFIIALHVTAFVNCSKVSTSESVSADPESNAVINFKAGFIAPTSSKGKAVRAVRRSTETQQNRTFVTLKEYRHKLLDRYFLTSRIQDQNLLENDAQVKNDWEQTGQKITVSEIELPGYSPLCRFYNSVTKTHFYTAQAVECEQLKGISGFVYEGIEGYAVAKNLNQTCGDLVPVYRVYANSADVQKRRHRYISDDSFLGSYVNKGWTNEKLSFCAEVVIKPTLTTVYPVDFSTATVAAWSSGAAGGSSSANQVCSPGSVTSQGCPVFSGGTSVKRCNAAGTGYGQCRASCHNSDDIISGMTSQTPSCVKRPSCAAGKKQCAGAGFNLAQDEFSVDCGDDGYDYNRDTANGAWNYLGYGIIQRKDNPSITGPVCCMNKDGSGLGCTTESVAVVPAEIIPDDEYVPQNPPPPPPPASQQSCSFNGQTIAHGATVTAFQSASSASCVSQIRTCQNGSLSGSYSFTSCTVTATPPNPPVTPPAGTACLNIPNFLKNNPLSPAHNYRKIYSTSTLADASHDQYRLKGNNTIWSVPLVVNAGDTTAGKLLAQMSFGEAPASQRAFRKMVIARSACDMSSSSGNIVLTTRSNSGSVQLAINDNSRGNTVQLKTGQYYINTQNTSCPTGQYCDALIEWLGVP